MPGTFSPPPRVSGPVRHHGTCVTHVPWCMSGSLTSGFLWSRWRGKRSRHSRRMRNPQFYVSGKRHIDTYFVVVAMETRVDVLVNQLLVIGDRIRWSSVGNLYSATNIFQSECCYRSMRFSVPVQTWNDIVWTPVPGHRSNRWLYICIFQAGNWFTV